MDTIREFLALHWFVRDGRSTIDERVLWFFYEAWCELEGRRPLCRPLFLRALASKGVANGAGLVSGIRLSEFGENLRTFWESVCETTLEEIVANEVLRKRVEDDFKLE